MSLIERTRRVRSYAELELAYDTRIPAGELELARLGSREAVALSHARSRIGHARREVVRAVHTMRSNRMAGFSNPIALSALHDARREHRQAWRELRAIEREITEGSEHGQG